MAIFIAKRVSDANVVWFRVSDSDGRSIPSCDDFLLHLKLRDSSVYTQRAYAIGLAHFFCWLHDANESPEHASRQVISRYIAEFSQSSCKVRLHRDRKIRCEVRARLITVSACWLRTLIFTFVATLKMAADHGVAA